MNDGDSLFLGLLCVAVACIFIVLVDAWVLRPRRDPGATSLAEPWLPKYAGYVLVGVSLALLWRLFKYEAVDFSLMLVIVGSRSRSSMRVPSFRSSCWCWSFARFCSSRFASRPIR